MSVLSDYVARQTTLATEGNKYHYNAVAALNRAHGLDIMSQLAVQVEATAAENDMIAKAIKEPMEEALTKYMQEAINKMK